MRHGLLILSLVSLAAGPALYGQDKPESNLPLNFEGNRIFSAAELSAPVEKCLAGKTRSATAFTIEKLEYCLPRLEVFLHSKGYLQARVGKPQRQESESGLSWLISVTEGRRYRLGEINIEDAKLLSPDQIREMLDLKTGDVLDTDRIHEWLYRRVSRIYKDSGYLQFSAEVEPAYFVKANSDEGVANLKVTIDEGPAFTIRSIRFDGFGDISHESLMRRMLVNVGEPFRQDLFEQSLKSISNDGLFEKIDPDKDVDYRVDRGSPLLDIAIHLKRKTP